MPNLKHLTVVFVPLALVVILVACSDVAPTGAVSNTETDQFEEIAQPTDVVAGQPKNSSHLDGTAWVLIELHGASPINGSRTTLGFADGFVSGFAGCNRYRPLIIGSNDIDAQYTATDRGDLAIPAFVITEKDCPTPDGVMEQEQLYIKALADAAAYRLEDDRLEIEDGSGRTTLVFAAKGQQQADPGDLVDTEWVLSSLDGKDILEGTNITLVVSADQAGGYAGCNSYGSAYAATDVGGFTLGEIESTAQGCIEPEGVLEQENGYIAALMLAAEYRIRDDVLEISDAAGETRLVFVRRLESPMNPGDLVGSAWRLIAWQGGSLIEGATITIAFQTGTDITGDAGCRDYVGTYEASGDAIRFPSLSMSGSLDNCSDDVALQESEYTTSLELVTHYRLDDAQLELLTARGEVLRFEPQREQPIETPTPPVDTPDPNVTLEAFETGLRHAIEMHDYDLMQSLMGDSFSVALWQSEGWKKASGEAIEHLRVSYLGADNAVHYPAAPDPHQYADGRDILSVWDPTVNPVRALFSAGWGEGGQAEAFLIIAQRPSGDYYWDGLLLAPRGFVDQGPEPQPIATPTPSADMDVWATYSNPAYAVSLEYPADWEPVTGYVAADGQAIRYAAINGFFHIGAMDTETIDDAATAEAEHRLQPYGSQPTIESLQVQGQEARLVLPSADQAVGMHYQAALIVRYPNPVNISGTMVRFFVLWADVAHIRTFGETLRFLP